MLHVLQFKKLFLKFNFVMHVKIFTISVIHDVSCQLYGVGDLTDDLQLNVSIQLVI